MNNNRQTTVGLMAPLLVGDPYDLTSEYTKKAFQEFEDLLRLKKNAARSPSYVSVDVWMAVFNPAPGVFRGDYYRKLFKLIIDCGYGVLPIMAFHSCGGNVGDNVNVPVRDWFWSEMLKRHSTDDLNDLLHVSEYGNASLEYPSPEAIDLALPFFSAMMVAFQDEFADMASHFVEISISLGPAGELRYPSLNAHDIGDSKHAHDNAARYPNRGTLQCYSNPAKASFRKSVFERYGKLEAVASAWSRDVATLDHMIIPPADTAYFFGFNEPTQTQYGRDFYDWYHQRLLGLGRRVMTEAIRILAAESAAFAGIPIGAKLAGINWGMGAITKDGVKLEGRFPELTAGIIPAKIEEWESDELGRGYRSVLSLFKELQTLSPLSPLVVHFTCLEMADGRDGHEAKSLAHTLVRWFGEEAKRQGIIVKGENALNFTIHSHAAWKRIRSVLKPGPHGLYSGLTILRITDVAHGVASEELDKTLEFIEEPSKTKD